MREQSVFYTSVRQSMTMYQSQPIEKKKIILSKDAKNKYINLTLKRLNYNSQCVEGVPLTRRAQRPGTRLWKKKMRQCRVGKEPELLF